jgi:hypothetical protein
MRFCSILIEKDYLQQKKSFLGCLAKFRKKTLKVKGQFWFNLYIGVKSGKDQNRGYDEGKINIPYLRKNLFLYCSVK